MMLLSWIQARIYQRNLRRLERRLKSVKTLAMLREAFRELGIPLDHLSDEELNALAMQIGETLYSTGMTVDEAAASLETVVRAWQQSAGGQPV